MHARRTADYIKLHCGDHVYDALDPRHVGRLESIRHSTRATVKWLKSGWLSTEIQLDRLRRAEAG